MFSILLQIATVMSLYWPIYLTSAQFEIFQLSIGINGIKGCKWVT